MADTKTSALTALTGATIATNDILPIVDTSAVQTKGITVTELLTGILGSTSLSGGTVTTSQPLLDLTQTWNAGAVTFTALKLNITNTASAAASLLMNLQVGGATQLAVRRDGALSLFDGGSEYIRLRARAGNAFTVYNTSDAAIFDLQAGSNTFWQGGVFGWSSNSSSAIAGQDLSLRRRGAANLALGAADAAAPVAQTLSVQSVVAGTTNTAGVNTTFTGSQGTGNAAGGSLIFQVAPAGSSGSAQNALAATLTLDSVGSVRVTRALTIATLPGTPATGMIARVTDASAPVIGATVAGGGAAQALCWYNGANWTVIGV